MSKTLSKRIGNFFGVLGAAIEVSAAVEHRRQPKSRDLEALGIDPDAFKRVNHF